LTENYPIILATTIPENIKSIELLVKLGFEFKESIKNNDESLSVYLKKM
jgi:[ribosomal protein S5]-alanine N-acetyltransferase